MSFLERPTVQRVIKALPGLGIGSEVIEISKMTETVELAAKELGVEPGSIVRSRLFTVGRQYAVAYIAGDKDFSPEAVGASLNIKGEVIRPKPEFARAITTFPVGGVTPIALPYKLPTVLDQSLKRFEERLYIPAGHSRCLLPISFQMLKNLTGGIVSYAVGVPRAEKTEG